MKLTLGDKSFWCFDRVIELYQQRLQWLTEDSKKVSEKDFILCPFHSFHLYLLESFQLQMVDLHLQLASTKNGISWPTQMKNPDTAVSRGSSGIISLSQCSPFFWANFILGNSFPSLGKVVTRSSKLTGHQMKWHIERDLPYLSQYTLPNPGIDSHWTSLDQSPQGYDIPPD